MNQIDAYIEAHDALALLNSDYEAKRKIIMASVAAELEALEAEFKEPMATARGNVAAHESALRAQCLGSCETIKHERLSIVFVKGRASWDIKALDGFAAAHPELAQFRTIGEPSTAIRWAK